MSTYRDKPFAVTSNHTLDLPLAHFPSELWPAEESTLGKRNLRSGIRGALSARQASVPDEVLVVDERARLRPAQWVESKLTRLLQEASMPVSHLQMRGLLKVR